jgi:subtilase family serine protease
VRSLIVRDVGGPAMKRAFAFAAMAIALLTTSNTARANVTDGIGATVPQFTQIAKIVGPADPTRKLRLVIFLAYPRQADVDAFAASVNDPGSPAYGRFLSPDQFATAYAPTPHSYTMVEYIVRNAGFQIIHTYANRKVIDVVGSVAQADALFNTIVDYYSYQNVTYYANSVPALVPSALKGIVMAVSGFNNFARKVAIPLASTLPPGPVGFGPADIETAYDEPMHVKPTVNGSHVTIAVETAYDYLDSDLTAYWSQYNVHRSGYVQRILVDDPVPQGLPAPGQSEETTLDLEQSSANAPGANVLAIEAADPLNATFDDVYERTVTDPRVDIVTTSWGSCEAGADPNEVAADNDLFEQGAAQGQTMIAASGDNGSKDCGKNSPPFGLPGYPNPVTVDFPSDSWWTAAAGGTTLTLNANRTIRSETAWSGSGGGVSALFALPPYQRPVPTLASPTQRNTPDVALTADPATPYSLYCFGSWAVPVGGTSAVAPNLAAMYAQFDGYFGHRLGLAQTGLYNGFFHGTYPGIAWHDIISGSNGDFSAHAGYDNVTGVGSLDAYRFMRQIPRTRGAARL